MGTCDELRAYLSSMWSRLGKPYEEQEAFLKKCSGFKPNCLEMLQVRILLSFFHRYLN